jgi:hypothetical protein
MLLVGYMADRAETFDEHLSPFISAVLRCVHRARRLQVGDERRPV